MTEEDRLDVILSEEITQIRNYEAPEPYLDSWLRCRDCTSTYLLQEDCKCQKPKPFEMRYKNYERQ